MPGRLVCQPLRMCFVLALTLTEKIGLVALTLTTATLLAAATNLALNYRWHRRAGHAELVVERHRLNENPGAAAGWQVFLDVRNKGPAPAFAPGMWIVQGTTMATTRDATGATNTFGPAKAPTWEPTCRPSPATTPCG